MSGIFNGTNAFLSAGNNLGFERTQTAAMSLWSQAAGVSPTTNQSLIGKAEPPSVFTGWTLQRSGAVAGDPFSVFLRAVNAATQIRVDFAAPNDTNWHHIAVSYDSSSTAAGVRLWVDGVEQVGTIVNNNLASSILNGADFALGARDGTDMFFAGRLAEVGVWIDLDELEFPAVVPQLAAGLRPIHATVIRSELAFYQHLESGINFASAFGPALTNNNTIFAEVDLPPLYLLPKLAGRRRGRAA